MGDEDLRALERAAASDEKARLRFAEAILKARGPGAALRALEPLLKEDSETAGLARRRALEIASSADRIDGAPSPVGSSRVDLQACKLEYSIVSPK